MSGSNNILNPFINDAELYDSIKTTMLANKQGEGVVIPLRVISYPLLPCSPQSRAWKGSAMMRKVVDNMVVTAGFGKHGKKLGEGPPPLGWPEDIAWVGYAGAARSKLTNTKMTRIITSMLVAAGIIPYTHVQVDNLDQNDIMQEALDDNNIINNNAGDAVVEEPAHNADQNQNMGHGILFQDVGIINEAVEVAPLVDVKEQNIIDQQDDDIEDEGENNDDEEETSNVDPFHVYSSQDEETDDTVIGTEDVSEFEVEIVNEMQWDEENSKVVEADTDENNTKKLETSIDVNLNNMIGLAYELSNFEESRNDVEIEAMKNDSGKNSAKKKRYI